MSTALEQCDLLCGDCDEACAKDENLPMTVTRFLELEAKQSDGTRDGRNVRETSVMLSAGSDGFVQIIAGGVIGMKHSEDYPESSCKGINSTWTSQGSETIESQLSLQMN
ncbi:hypothetical protein Tcan_14360 [Toxocara canis]|uniref:Uncharacterized protein n=2 Tax=Toxocara canis TaxID=6265 RepID=A0A0B2UMN6_TOXCA|nr:hypothetical protein Tcan_14360 [Toxocara canis]VDM49968.1 unnamed protein product [Toxocara canis]